jgi:MFS family permease|tara:strand:- start:2035 stop:3240 length:1206 start_codon:yes stop_codon:yes gene_type:complete
MKYPGQLKNNDFRKLWISDILIGSADNIEMLIISWVIITKTNSGLILGTYGATRFFSTFFAPLFGSVIDRFNKKTTLSLSRSYMIIHSIIFLIFALQNILTTFNIIFITFFYGIARTSDRISREALTQILIKKKDLRNASGIIRATMDFTKIISPIIGAMIYTNLGIEYSYLIICILYIGALLAIYPINIHSTNQQNLILYKELLSGLTYLSNNKTLISLISFAALVNFTVLTLPNAYLPFISKNILNGNANDLALLISFASIGSLIGSIIISVNNFSNTPGKFLIIFIFIWHILMLGTSLFTIKLVIICILILFGISSSITMVNMSILILSITDKNMIGRIIGIRQLAIFTLPIGLILSGYMIDKTGIISSIQIMSAIGIIISIILSFKSKHLMSYTNTY